MSNNNKEEEQLLQDASTLLMFANVAAKQQKEQHERKASPTSPLTQMPLPVYHSNPHSQDSLQSPVSLHQPLRTPKQSIVQQLQLPLQQPQHQTVNDYNTQQVDRRLQEKFQVQHTYITSGGKVTPPLQTKSLPESSRSSISENTNPVVPKLVEPNQYNGRSLPPDGSFAQQGHKRSLSSPGVEATSISQSPHLFNGHSPGPASVALSRGINIESGKRNNNNAMIAAAALAAAADIPLPLIKKGEEAAKLLKETSAEHSQETPSQIKKENATDNQIEESVMTEPEEEDVNETDDEQPSKPNEDTQNLKKIDNLREEEQMNANFIGDKSSALLSQTKLTNIPDGRATTMSLTTDEPKTSNKQQFMPPPLSSYQVDPDAGLIGCICGIEDDDGFTIQCDICFRWQHCLCMDFGTNDEVPEDEYKCYYCDEAKWGKFDANLCRLSTLRRLELDKLPDKSNHTEGAKPPNKRKRLNSDSKNDEKKKRRTTEKQNDNNQEKSLEKKQVTRPEPANTTDITINSATKFLPNKNNELLDNGISAEQYQSVYYKLKSNDYKKMTVKNFLDEMGSKFYSRYCQLNKNEQDACLVDVMTSDQLLNLKFSNVVLPNQDAYLRENKEFHKKQNNFNGTSVQVKLYAENQKQKFNGITRLGLFITSNSQEITIPEETSIIEYLGEIDLFDNYKSDRINQYSALGTPKPKVLKMKLNLPSTKENELLEVVSDARFVGNESRFIRKACPSTSNCKIKTVYIPQTNSFKFLVVTSKPIALSSNTHEEELRLDWEWDRIHPIRRMYPSRDNKNEEPETLKFDQFSDEDKAYLITSIDNILHFVECGCCTANSGTIQSGCAIFKVKKATSYLLRSTRKASSISNINFSKSREELIIPKKPRRFISWEERLIERDRIIQMDLHVTTNVIDNDFINGHQFSDDQETDKEEIVSNKRHDITSPMKESEVPYSSKSLFFSLPFKQQIISKGRKLMKEIKRDVMKKDFSVNTETENGNFEERSEFLSVSVPVVPELVVKIRQSLDKEIEPIPEIESKFDAETTETANNKAESTLSRSNNSLYVTLNSAITPTHSAGSHKIENSIAAVADVPKDEKAVETPPPTIKKLSFADYKKKMK